MKLNPCSNCQGNPIPEYYGNLNGESATSIGCICGRQSPICDTESEAIECWQYSNGPVYLNAIKDLKEKNK